jgi:hypothetical protein
MQKLQQLHWKFCKSMWIRAGPCRFPASQGTERPNKGDQLQPGKGNPRPSATYPRSPRRPRLALHCSRASTQQEGKGNSEAQTLSTPSRAAPPRPARTWPPPPTPSPPRGADAARGRRPSSATSPPRSRPTAACPASPRGLPPRLPPPLRRRRRPSSPSTTATPPRTSPRTPPPLTSSPSRRPPHRAPPPAARRHGTCPGARCHSRHQDPPWLGSSSRPGKRCSLCRRPGALAPHLLLRQRRRSHRCPPRRHRLGWSRWRTEGRSNGRSGSLYSGEKTMLMLCFVLDY